MWDKTTLSEDTCASLDAIVVHESDDYFLVEITSPRARGLIDERHGFLERLLQLSPPRQDMPPRMEHLKAIDETSEMNAVDRSNLVEASAQLNDVESQNLFKQRPTTNTWPPESSSKQDPVDASDAHRKDSERARQMLIQRIRARQVE